MTESWFIKPYPNTSASNSVILINSNRFVFITFFSVDRNVYPRVVDTALFKDSMVRVALLQIYGLDLQPSSQYCRILSFVVFFFLIIICTNL